MLTNTTFIIGILLLISNMYNLKHANEKECQGYKIGFMILAAIVVVVDIMVKFVI